VVERDHEGRPRRMLGTVVDVHDAKLHELEAQRERSLFSQGPVVMVRMRVRPDHARWLYVSPNVRKCWGHDPEELLRMEDAFELLHPDDRHVMRERFVEALRSNSLSVEFEGRIRMLSGDYRWNKYYTHLDPVTMERRGYIIDIHERKQAEVAGEVQGAELQRLVGELQAAHRENEILQETGDLLHTTDRLDEAFDIIRVAGERLFEGWSGWVAASTEASQLALRAQWGRGQSNHPPGFEERECWALRRNKPHRYRHVGEHVCCGHLAGVEPALLRPYLCLPMVAHGETVGLMHLWADDGREVDDADMTRTESRATRLTETLKLALSNLRLRESLREQATRDVLTGLFNRRHFDATLAIELARARRERRPLTLAMLDIDHFKRFNDTWGHEAGDEVLRAVAGALAARARGYDVACRYGGEELALLLPGCRLSDAVPKLEGIREAIRSLKVVVGDRALPPVTVSIGVASTIDGAADQLVRRADECLYDAKRQGRDRVRHEAGDMADADAPADPVSAR
jgi:diguanylate cyclase (GGDEF)-like protein/PAS domain S-box-containing protein